jgi:hypothetical protein
MVVDRNSNVNRGAGRARGQFAGKEHSVTDASHQPDAGEDLPTGLEEVLESAARLQKLVPDAVLVGGSSAPYYHRMATDLDLILTDLQDRFRLVLDALDRDVEFVLNRAAPGKIILGELDGIEAGVRLLIRKHPLEVQRVLVHSAAEVIVPTLEEVARIKGYLIVKRNQMGDYLDVAALSGKFGADHIGAILTGIDDYYSDDTHPDDHPVQSQLARQLADPAPKERSRIKDLATYKQLEVRWQNWDAMVAECRRLAAHMV